MIQAFLDFLAKNPGAWGILVPIVFGIWGMLTTLVSALLGAWIPDTDEKWTLFFTRHPKLAPWAGILKYGGTATWSFLRACKSVAAGPPPSLPMPKTVADLKGLEAVVAAQVAAAAKGTPAPGIEEKAAISIAARNLPSPTDTAPLPKGITQ